MRRARLATAAGAVVLATTMAGCGGGDDVGPKPSLPSETPALFNPCDGLDAAQVTTAVGSTTPLTESAGRPTSPECRFFPPKGSGQPAVTVNYTLFSGTLQEYFARMGAANADVTTPRVTGADDARLVVSAEKDQLYVTGFVQTGTLFQVINVVDPRPYDRAQAQQGTVDIMGALVKHARTTAGSGLDAPTPSSPAPSSSPS
ncbi:hypothetical protein [Nocardioides sp.]|uniref:hypothetical protein n=1 Tax=Nocardioides sp. TaxID=35761 RepID=UPI003514CED9